jgi:hypothetical protein
MRRGPRIRGCEADIRMLRACHSRRRGRVRGRRKWRREGDRRYRIVEWERVMRVGMRLLQSGYRKMSLVRRSAHGVCCVCCSTRDMRSRLEVVQSTARRQWYHKARDMRATSAMHRQRRPNLLSVCGHVKTAMFGCTAGVATQSISRHLHEAMYVQ